MTNNIYLRCSVIILLCATTFAAPGGFGSFVGSNAAAFSSASSNAQAGFAASAASSANAFTGGIFPSKNPDGTSHGLTHQQGISVGSGSYVGTGNIHPGSDNFGLSHQSSGGIKGSYNNHKSQLPCSQCPHTKEKWEYDNYDEQPEEKEEETHGEEEGQNDCDDGQYRPEYHYKHDKSGDGKEHEEETVPGVYKIGNSDQYNYDQENDKGAYTPSSNKEQGNNNYGNTGLAGTNNQNLNNNYGDYQYSTKYPFANTNAGNSKDFSHLSITPSDFNKKKENDNKNFGTPGVVIPILGAGNNYGNTNKSPFGSATPSQTNLGSVSGINAGCSNSGSGGGCSISGADSNLNQGPVKIGQTHLTQAPNAPSLITDASKGTPGCNSLYGNCGNGKTDGTGQYQSTPVGNGQNLQSGYSGGISAGNKPHSYDQQHINQPSKGNLPSGPGSNVGAGSGCATGSPSSACSDEGTSLQKNLPVSTQTYGTAGSGPGYGGIGSTPIPAQTHGTFGSGAGNIGLGNKPYSYDQQHTRQPSTSNLPSGPGAGNIGLGNKPYSYDQQHTGQPSKDNLPNGPGSNVGAGSGCAPGSPSSACSNGGKPLQKNLPVSPQPYATAGSGPGYAGIGSTPIPAHTYGTFGSGSTNVGLGNKPYSYDQQYTVQPSKGNLLSGPGSNVGVGSGCATGSPSSACSDEGTSLQKNLPVSTQTYGTAGSGPGYAGIGSTSIPAQTHGTFGSGAGNIGLGNKPYSYDQQHTRQSSTGNLPSGPGAGNIGLGNKPYSYDQQYKVQPSKDNLPSGPGSNVGVGSGCAPGSSSAACSNEGKPLQKNLPVSPQPYATAGSGPGYAGIGSTPIPAHTYGTFGSGSTNVGLGNKPYSYDQQYTVQPSKGNLLSGPGSNVGVGSGCATGSPSSACSDEGTSLQKNLPVSTQTYGTAGSGPGYAGIGSTSIPAQTHGTFGSGAGNIGLGNKPYSYDQQHTRQPSTGNLPSGPGAGNIGLGNKPYSYDQQHTGQPSKDNLPNGPGSNVGAGSGCAPGSPSSACSNGGKPLQKNLPVSPQTYATAGSGAGYAGIGSTPIPAQRNGTFGSRAGNIGLGNKPYSYDQHNIGQPKKGNLPSGTSGTVGGGSDSVPEVSSAPCNDEGTPLQKNIPISSQAFGSAGSGFNVNSQPGYGNQNSYQFNAENPFLHGGKNNFISNVYTTSSPFSNSFSTTLKPVGFGNPFLDGTVTNTFGSQHFINDKHTLGVTPIKNDVPNKPIGVGNPFLSNGSGSTIIQPDIKVEISNTDVLPSAPSTVKPIGQNNPFFGTSSGNSVNKYPTGIDSNKNTPFGIGTSNPFSSEDQGLTIQFPKSKQTLGILGVIGISSSGNDSNTNQGIKGDRRHKPTFGSVATSNAGAFNTGFNTPNAYNNNNNAGHGTGSLIGTANIKKPSYTLLNSPGTSLQTSGSDNSANSNRNSLSNSSNNENNINGQFNPQIGNAEAQSFAGASAKSYSGSFSSSQASSSSSSFASSKSGSYSANGDSNILPQLNGNWPLDVGRNLDGTNSGWQSLNAGSQASAFASSSAGSWSKPQPFGEVLSMTF